MFKDYKAISVKKKIHAKLLKALAGCSGCRYEESDGGLLSHCSKCQFEVTSLTYQMLNDSSEHTDHEDTLRRASMGEEPLRSPSVDASETRKKDALNISLRFDPKEVIADFRRAAMALEREFQQTPD